MIQNGPRANGEMICDQKLAKKRAEEEEKKKPKKKKGGQKDKGETGKASGISNAMMVSAHQRERVSE